ncbi:HNH endonuclease [Deinococcus sp. HMF7604]|uniref:HNH endonuclease n=1 Tax=Deinococcus betulae TaxID=2873312 RepID=UPI001CCDD67E|nr:HNH endonuclease [Deinococcus betulae]
MRRAREWDAAGSYTPNDIKAKYSLQGGRCYYCKEYLHKAYNIDHKIPLSKGGTNWPANLCVACETCNKRKNNLDFFKFIAYL